MKDLTVFYITYSYFLKDRDTTMEAAIDLAGEAQASFDEYIAQQAEASRLQPVEAETAMPNITEAISPGLHKRTYSDEVFKGIKDNPMLKGSLVEQDQPEPKCGGNCGTMYCSINGCEYAKAPCKPEQPERFYWKSVSEFTEEDAYRDSDNILIAEYSRGAVGFFTSFDDMNTDSVGVTKYLARCKEDKGEFVPCWEWANRKHETQWDNDSVDEVKVHKSANEEDGYFFCIEAASGMYYFPTLEAAQLEAERHYNLYVKK